MINTSETKGPIILGSIQQLLGHGDGDILTTMIYTHSVKSTTIKEAQNPFDI